MKRTILFKVLPVVAVLGVSIVIASSLIASRPQAEMGEQKVQRVPVEVMVAQLERRRVKIIAMGTVIPARELRITPEVAGRIIKINPKLEPGGFLSKDEEIARIDRRDYASAVSQQRARLREAQSALEIEEGRQAIAKREWELMSETVGVSDYNDELALRKPQLANAKAAVSSARSALYQANLKLARTVIKAPFNAIVRRKSVEIGQIVSQQTPLATLVGADRYWVQAGVPVNQLPWIHLPDEDGLGGATAGIFHQIGTDMVVEREGRVIRLFSDLDPAGRLARLLIEVDDPLGVKFEGERKKFPLLIDAYVRVEIEGPELENVFVIPRKAVHEGGQVWIMDENDKLAVRNPSIAWRTENVVFIKEGIKPGERIVTSNIPTPIPGILLSAGNN